MIKINPKSIPTLTVMNAFLEENKKRTEFCVMSLQWRSTKERFLLVTSTINYYQGLLSLLISHQEITKKWSRKFKEFMIFHSRATFPFSLCTKKIFGHQSIFSIFRFLCFPVEHCWYCWGSEYWFFFFFTIWNISLTLQLFSTSEFL